MEISGDKSKSLFDMWVNVCQFQGSRTIRTEEALLISLARLRPFLFSIPIESKKKERTNLPKTVDFSDDEVSEESSSEDEED